MKSFCKIIFHEIFHGEDVNQGIDMITDACV